MSSFPQVCPSCKSSLELPIEADGKTAVCPACETQFIAHATLNAPMLARGRRSEKPPHTPPTRSDDRQVSIESVLGDTQTIFSSRRRPLLLPFLVPSLMVGLGGVVPIALLSELALTHRSMALVGFAMLSPVFVLLVSYAVWFALNRSIEVCDAAPQVDPNDVPATRCGYLPDRRVFFALSMVVLIAMLWAATMVTLTAVMINLSSKLVAIEIRALVFGGTLVGTVVLTTVVAMRTWPLFPLAMEGRFGAPVIREALAMTRANPLTSFLIVVTAALMVGFGFSLFGIGLPIAIPLSALLSVVALRLIQGRRIPAIESDRW
jgi:hypothetical protein